MEFKVAIFDMDGTLVDSLFFWDIFWNKFGEKYLSDKAFKAPDEVNTRVRACMFNDSMRLIHAEYVPNVSVDELITFGNDMVIWFYSEKAKIKDGVVEFLEYLKANNIKTCIASASAKDKIAIALERCGLNKYIDAVFSCDDIGVGKEKPDVFIKAAEFFGAKISDSCVFEDSLIPAATAKNAGFQTVGVCDKHNNFNQEELKNTVDIYIAENETLAKLIK